MPRTVQPPQPSQPVLSGAAVCLSDALLDAQELQAGYAQAITDLSQATHGTAASLLGLTTLGLIKGVVDPSAREIAGLGVLGGGLFTAGSTLLPRGRSQAYLAGIKALECALTVARPYAVPDARVPRSVCMPGHGAGKPAAQLQPEDFDPTSRPATLEQAIARVQDAVAELDAWAVHLELLARIETKRERRGGPKASCNADPISCGPIAAASPEDRARQDRQCAQLRKQQESACAPAAWVEVEERPHPDVVAAKRETELLSERLRASLVGAWQWQARVDQAGAVLRGHSTWIQKAVAEEIHKTEPDLAAVKAAAAGIRDAGTALLPPPGASTMQPQPGKSQSGPETTSPRTAKTRPQPFELSLTRTKLSRARKALEALDGMVTQGHERVRVAQASLSAACSEAGALGGNLVPEPQRVAPAPLVLDDPLRDRLAQMLGIGNATNARQQVNERLAECRAAGVGGSNPSVVELELLSALLTGRCGARSTR